MKNNNLSCQGRECLEALLRQGTIIRARAWLESSQPQEIIIHQGQQNKNHHHHQSGLSAVPQLTTFQTQLADLRYLSEE